MDIDSKYDRGRPPTPLNEVAARELLAPFLNGRPIDFLKLLSGGDEC